MKNLSARIERIRKCLNPKDEMKVFDVRYGHEDTDFEQQHKEYIANDGNPDALFVVLVNYQNHEGAAA